MADCDPAQANRHEDQQDQGPAGVINAVEGIPDDKTYVDEDEVQQLTADGLDQSPDTHRTPSPGDEFFDAGSETSEEVVHPNCHSGDVDADAGRKSTDSLTCDDEYMKLPDPPQLTFDPVHDPLRGLQDPRSPVLSPSPALSAVIEDIVEGPPPKVVVEDVDGWRIRLPMENIVLPLEAVVGLRFDLLAEPHRTQVEGHMMIVRQGESYSKENWVLWNKCIFHAIMLYLGACQIVGAVTAALLYIGAIHFHQELSRYCLNEYGIPYRQQLEYLSIGGIVSFFLTLTFWFVPVFFSWKVQLTVGLFSALVLFLETRSHFLQQWFGLSGDWKIPEINYPIQISFNEDEMANLFKVRGQLKELCWEKICHLVVGSYWSEAVCSVIFYRDIYNSRRARFLGYIFFNFLLPAIFAIQVSGIAYPVIRKHYLRFQNHVRTDFGVRFGAFFGSQFHFQVPAKLQAVFDALQAPVIKLAAWGSVISSWLIPFDEGFVYIKAKLYSIKVMLDPVVWAAKYILDMVRQVGGVFGPRVTLVVQFMFRWGSRLASLNRTATNLHYNPTLRKIKKNVDDIVSPTQRRDRSASECEEDSQTPSHAIPHRWSSPVLRHSSEVPLQHLLSASASPAQTHEKAD